MATRFSKWMIYISSFEMLYLLLILKMLLRPTMNDTSIINRIMINFIHNRWFIITLVIFLTISEIWIRFMAHWKNNTRIRCRISENKTIEMVTFIFPYMLSFCTIDISDLAFFMNIVLFFILGMAFVGSNKLYLNPMFMIQGFKLYGNESVLTITKLSMEELNRRIDEGKDGVEARELCRNIYLIK